MEPQKILNNQSSVEKEQNWKQHAPWFKSILIKTHHIGIKIDT